MTDQPAADPFVALWAKRESAKVEYEAAGSVYGAATHL